MQIIPVIDLLDGVVVHAKKGKRQHYQAIQSQLSATSKPLDIVSALLALYPFTQLYIADLNAIQKTRASVSTNYNVIEAISLHFPQLSIFLDAGIKSQTELNTWQKLNVRLVIGSENFTQIDRYRSLNHHQQPFILSLDFFPHGYQGPAELLTNTDYWPQDVIVMSLAHVGANQGVNQGLLAEIISRAKYFNIYAAGGIRDAADLIMLKQLGVTGALVATALHQQKISSQDIKRLTQ
ncbi:MAG: nickel transporter [Methylotenera sp.]|nr:nickel transporter [Methylotenera sp.]